MFLRASVFILVFCAASYGTSAQSPRSKKSSPSDLFTIGKTSVSQEEFVYLYRKNHPQKQGEYTKEKVEEYLQLFVNFKLKVAEAIRRGMDTTASFQKEYNTYREELRKPYLPDSKLTDSLAELTYSRMKEEVRASHLLIRMPPDPSPDDTLKAYQRIIELRKKIASGEDFGQVAFQHSEDESAKANRGDLGYFTAFQMVFPFEQAAYNTPVGSVSMPIRTQFGYHLVYVTDRRPSRGEVEVSHIMLRTGENFDNEKAKDRIFEIYDQLQKGVKWEELCNEHSEDVTSKANGGRLRPFGAGAMGAVPQFEQIAFALRNPGDVSDPFQTQFGWHIVRLEKKIPLPPYSELSASLKNRVNRDERAQISRQMLSTKMKKEFGFHENEETKKQLMTFADSSLIEGHWNPGISSAEQAKPLFSMGGKEYSTREFLAFANQRPKPGGQSPEAQLRTLYDQFVAEAQGIALEQRIASQNPDYKWLLKEYYEGILLFEIMEKEVWNKASEDSTGQKKYYETHQQDYRAGERARGKIFSSASKDLIAQLKPLVEQNDSLKVQQFVSAQKIRQESGAFEKTERPVLAKIDWAPGIHLSENNGFHYLVWIRNIVSPSVRTFDEARPAIISDYQNYLEKQWVDSLKKRHSVKVNKKAKQAVLQQLTTGT